MNRGKEKIARESADDASLPKTEMLEAAKASIYLTDIIEKPHPVPSEYREIISNFFEPNDNSRRLLHTLARFEREGIDLWDAPLFMEDFKIMAAEAKQIWLAKNPSLSQIGGATPRDAQMGRIVARWSCVDDIFIRGARVGGSMVIYGEMDAGKTDIATAEVWNKFMPTPWYLTTNIPIKDPPEKSKFSTKLSTTLLHALEHSVDCIQNNKPDMTAAILDEQQFSMPKERGTSDKNLFMKQTVLLSRKLKIFYCGIYQQKKFPNIIDEFARHIIQKPSVDRKDVAVLQIKPISGIRYDATISGIKPAKDYGIEFETDSTYVYTPDINPLRMFDFHDSLTLKPMSVLEQKLELIKYVKAHMGEKLDIISDDVKTAVLYGIRLRLKDSEDKMDRKVATQEYLARMVGWTRDKLVKRFMKHEEALRDGLIIPDDPDDMIREIAGAVGVADDEDEERVTN